MTAIASDRNLLFGLLALQNGLINQVQLVAAFQAWMLDRARALADHFIALGHLNEAQRAVVEAMADLHVAKHGDMERSLAAVSAGRSTRESLAQIGDAQIHATLARLSSALTDRDEDADADSDRTASYGVADVRADRRPSGWLVACIGRPGPSAWSQARWSSHFWPGAPTTGISR